MRFWRPSCPPYWISDMMNQLFSLNVNSQTTKHIFCLKNYSSSLKSGFYLNYHILAAILSAILNILFPQGCQGGITQFPNKDTRWSQNPSRTIMRTIFLGYHGWQPDYKINIMKWTFFSNSFKNIVKQLTTSFWVFHGLNDIDNAVLTLKHVKTFHCWHGVSCRTGANLPQGKGAN